MPPDPARCRRRIAVLAGLAAFSAAVLADEVRAPANVSLQAIIVKARKVPVILPDAEV
jgi:hypothetical protein